MICYYYYVLIFSLPLDSKDILSLALQIEQLQMSIFLLYIELFLIEDTRYTYFSYLYEIGSIFSI